MATLQHSFNNWALWGAGGCWKSQEAWSNEGICSWFCSLVKQVFLSLWGGFSYYKRERLAFPALRFEIVKSWGSNILLTLKRDVQSVTTCKLKNHCAGLCMICMCHWFKISVPGCYQGRFLITGLTLGGVRCSYSRAPSDDHFSSDIPHISSYQVGCTL